MSDETTMERFPFPKNPTRRERLLFEQHAGISFTEFGVAVKQIRDAGSELDVAAASAVLTEKVQCALLLIAVRRARPGENVTFEQVLDRDEWVLANDDEDDGESDLPAPLPETATASSSPPGGSA